MLENTIGEVTLQNPISINVTELALNMPSYQYIGPYTSNNCKFFAYEYIVDTNDNYQAVIGFNFPLQNGSFTKMTSGYSPKKLFTKLTIGGASKSNLDLINKSLQEIGIEMPTTISENEIKTIEKQKHLLKLLDEINDIGQAETIGYFSSKEAMSIMQHGVGYTNCNSNKSILGTYGAGPCVIVAMYNPTSKTSALAHIDTLTTLYPSLNQIAYKLTDMNQSNIEIHLRGGDSSSRDMVLKIIDYLSGYLTKKYNISIKSASLISDNNHFEVGGKELY